MSEDIIVRHCSPTLAGMAVVLTASEFSASMMDSYDGVAFGCPAMGDEVLEEDEFQPMFDSCEPKLGGKKRK